MVFSHIHSSNDKKQISQLNKHIEDGKPAFLLIYMEGCGPCNATRPEWNKLENVITNFKKNENVMIADVDQTFLHYLPSIKENPVGFPTILFIQGKEVEHYEKERSIDEFANWIRSKKIKNELKGGRRMTKKIKRGKREKKTIKKNTIKIYTLRSRTRRRRRPNTKKIGGLLIPQPASKYDHFYIQNTEIILFLIDFISKTDLKSILIAHHKFIDTIQDQKLDFKENKEFRAFINDIVQWFLLDYDKQFLNSLLEIIKNTLENPIFLNTNIDIEQRYNVILDNVYAMIEKENTKTNTNQENINIFILLEIILRLLRMPTIKEKIISIIQTQEKSLISFKKTIVCLLDFLIKEDLLHNEEIRNLLKEFIEELSYNNAYSWTTFKKLMSLVKQCSFTITSDVSSIAAKKVYSNTIGKFF